MILKKHILGKKIEFTDSIAIIPKDMKLDEVRDLLVDHFLNEGELESVGIEIIDRTDDKLKRLRKGKA